MEEEKDESNNLDWFALIFLALLLYGVITRVLPSLRVFLERLKDGDAPQFLVATHDAILFVLDGILVISIAGITFVLFKMAYLRRQKLKALITIETTPKDEGGIRWEKIIKLISSSHPSDWKVAIIEADTILYEMIDAMGYAGDTLGEKLKGIEKSDFTTLDEAWEAHKFRNKIAHSGELVTQRKAKLVIGLYEKVFREFGYL